MAELDFVMDADGGALIRILNAAVVQGADLCDLQVRREGQTYRVRIGYEGLAPESEALLARRVETSPSVRVENPA